MDTMFLIKNLKAVTTFNKKEIPAEILAEILDGGRLTPTKNLQDWKFVVIKNTISKTKIATATNAPYFADANTIIAVFSKSNKFRIEYTSAAISAMFIAANHYNLGASWQPVYDEPYAKEISTFLNALPNYDLMGLLALGYYDFSTAYYRSIPPLSQMVIQEKFK